MLLFIASKTCYSVPGSLWHSQNGVEKLFLLIFYIPLHDFYKYQDAPNNFIWPKTFHNPEFTRKVRLEIFSGKCPGIATALPWHCHGIAMALPWHLTRQCHGNAKALLWQCHGIALALPWQCWAQTQYVTHRGWIYRRQLLKCNAFQ